MNIASFVFNDSSAWDRAVLRCQGHDIYHLAAYHKAVAKNDEIPALFRFNRDGENACLPLLFSGDRATSIYGYPGPLCSDNSPSPEFISWFQFELKAHLKKHSISFLETRLNPLLSPKRLFESMMDIRDVGTTVAIDLSVPLKLSKGHKCDVKKAREVGVTVSRDTDWKYLDIFINQYYETMTRTGARENYFFPESYFRKLRDYLGEHAQLWVAIWKDIVISSALFFFTSNIVQYHLSGTEDDYTKMSGAKVMLCDVAEHAKEQGYRWLHLGGGLGGSEDDPLFTFKKGFSKLRLPFYVANWEKI